MFFASTLMADAAEDSLAAKVDDLFMKASSGEVQFRDLVEPAKKEKKKPEIKQADKTKSDEIKLDKEDLENRLKMELN